MIEVELVEQPNNGDWTLSLKGSNGVEARGQTPFTALGKFLRGNREVLGIDWLDDHDPETKPLTHEALGQLIANNPDQYGIQIATTRSSTQSVEENS